MTNGERLATLRENKNLTQSDLAEMLSVTEKTVLSWETNLSFPNSSNLVKLAKLLDTNTNYLSGADSEQFEENGEIDFALSGQESEKNSISENENLKLNKAEQGINFNEKIVIAEKSATWIYCGFVTLMCIFFLVVLFMGNLNDGKNIFGILMILIALIFCLYSFFYSFDTPHTAITYKDNCFTYYDRKGNIEGVFMPSEIANIYVFFARWEGPLGGAISISLVNGIEISYHCIKKPHSVKATLEALKLGAGL